MTTSLEQTAPVGLADALPPELDLTIVSRNPTRLSEATVEKIMRAAPPRRSALVPATTCTSALRH